MTEFGLYVSRLRDFDDVLELLPEGHPIDELVVGLETSRGRILLGEDQATDLETDANDRGIRVRYQVWPGDGVSPVSYDLLSAADCVADIEHNDRDGTVLGVERYAGVTTVPLHALTGSESFRKAKEREVQIYPIHKKSRRGHRYSSRGAGGAELIDPVHWWLSEVCGRSGLEFSDLSVALPLWGLKPETAREELERWTRRAIELGVVRIRYWDAKHIIPDEKTGDLDDATRAFILEDLPRIVADTQPSEMVRAGVDFMEEHDGAFGMLALEERVAKLEAAVFGKAVADG